MRACVQSKNTSKKTSGMHKVSTSQNDLAHPLMAIPDVNKNVALMSPA